MAKQTEENGAAVATNVTSSNNAAAGMGAMGFGDITMIRNILMGQQIATWEEKFQQVDARQDKELAENHAALKSLETATRQQLRDLEKRTEDRFALVDALSTTGSTCYKKPLPRPPKRTSTRSANCSARSARFC